MNKIIFYGKQNCCLCDEVRSLVEILQNNYEIDVKEVDIEGNRQLEQKYLVEIPVLNINGQELEYRQIDLSAIRERLH
ncbi:glutaredoxin family protein [Halobacillus sp. B23F22_1]|uniref:glutaredoxin family protein n=1 Tax=Halobacillus sp. B23F22_1 TaxID=3459514 RepID=UPI00373EA872